MNIRTMVAAAGLAAALTATGAGVASAQGFVSGTHDQIIDGVHDQAHFGSHDQAALSGVRDSVPVVTTASTSDGDLAAAVLSGLAVALVIALAGAVGVRRAHTAR